MKNEITVSVCCATYNHEPYIRQCLDGFVMQKTDFAFEVLINDDASTDNTADIIREYEEKYPDIIKPIYQPENRYSQGVPISATFNWSRAKGKYIAQCEGDDYWTDPLKLQKQVDFLEANEDYSLCCHNVKIWKEVEQKWSNNYAYRLIPETTTIVDLANGNYLYTASMMFRCDERVFSDFSSIKRIELGDYFLRILNAKYGKIKRLNDTMAVYRVHSGGVWSMQQRASNYIKAAKMVERLKPSCAEHNIDAQFSKQQELLLSIAWRDAIQNGDKKLASEISHLYQQYDLPKNILSLSHSKYLQLIAIMKLIGTIGLKFYWRYLQLLMTKLTSYIK